MTLMPLLMVEECTRSRIYLLINVPAVTEISGRDALDKPWEDATNL